jgi:hypothetical protein
VSSSTSIPALAHRLSVSHWRRLSLELQSLILELLALDDLHRLIAGCPSLSHDIQNHLVRRVTFLLARFFLDYDATMAFMKSTNSRITGCCALDVVLTSSIRSLTLDFVVNDDLYDDAENFFVGAGYTMCQEEPSTVIHTTALPFLSSSVVPLAQNDRVAYLPHMSIGRVVNFSHALHDTCIKVIVSNTKSTLPPILSLTTTLLMNWITHDSIGCAYPALTLQGKGVSLGPCFDFPFITPSRVQEHSPLDNQCLR